MWWSRTSRTAVVFSMRSSGSSCANERYQRTYGLHRKTMKSGMSFREILGAVITAGMYPGFDLDELYSKRTTLFREESASEQLWLSDGRVAIQQRIHFTVLRATGFSQSQDQNLTLACAVIVDQASIRCVERPALVSLRHCLHQKRERPSETYSTGIAALVVSKAHHDEIVRWDDQCGLAPCACHVICVPRYRKRSVTVDPEEAAVDRALVGLPCGRKCAYKLDVPFRENLLAIPNAILKIQISKTCPVASGSQFVALPEKVSKRIRFHHHSVDTELVEERPLRKRQIFLPTLFHAEAYQIVDQYWIGVVIASDRVLGGHCNGRVAA